MIIIISNIAVKLDPLFSEDNNNMIS
jgi:hypothetical protein